MRQGKRLLRPRNPPLARAWRLPLPGALAMVLLAGQVWAASSAPPAAAARAAHPAPARPPREPAVTTRILSLGEAVSIGLRNNPSVRSAYAGRSAERFDLRVAEDVFTPHATLGGTAGGQHIAGLTTQSADVSPGVAWTSPVGTSVTFAWGNTATHAPGLDGRTSVLLLGVSQPLLRGAGLDVNTAPVRNARLAEDLNQLRLRATVADTVTTIVATYRMLLRAQESKILADSATTRAQALVDIDEELIQAGRMAEVELVQVQADVENQRIAALQAEAQVEATRIALAALLDLDLSTTIVARDTLKPTQTSIPVDKALQIAFVRRPDYLGQVLLVEQAKLGITIANDGLLWDLSLYGTGRLGRQTAAPGLLSTATKVADAAVGLQLNVPLNDLRPTQAALHASTSLTEAEIGLKAAHQSVEQQVRTGVGSIDLRWRELEIARRARTLASQAVDIEKQKLNVGRSSNFQVQTLEAAFRAAESQQLNATIDYLNALSALDQQLGTTLDTWKIALTD